MNIFGVTFTSDSSGNQFGKGKGRGGRGSVNGNYGKGFSGNISANNSGFGNFPSNLGKGASGSSSSVGGGSWSNSQQQIPPQTAAPSSVYGLFGQGTAQAGMAAYQGQGSSASSGPVGGVSGGSGFFTGDGTGIVSNSGGGNGFARAQGSFAPAQGFPSGGQMPFCPPFPGR